VIFIAKALKSGNFLRRQWSLRKAAQELKKMEQTLCEGRGIAFGLLLTASVY
jgi:hypothetical protein